MPDKIKSLVIGGGVADMGTASFLKDLGFDVTLVERGPTVGGMSVLCQW